MTDQDRTGGQTTDQDGTSAEAPRTDAEAPDAAEVPFFQRLYDRPFVLLALGLAVMLILFTAWGLWEVMTLPEAPLP